MANKVTNIRISYTVISPDKRTTVSIELTKAVAPEVYADVLQELEERENKPT